MSILPLATTVGFLVKETTDVLVVAGTYEANQSNNRMKIPKACSKTFKLLKVTENIKKPAEAGLKVDPKSHSISVNPKSD